MSYDCVMNDKKYRVVGRIIEEGMENYGQKLIFFEGPLTHSEAVNCLKSLTKYSWRTEFLEEIS